MRIIRLSLPTPFYVGPVNVYAIALDPVTLVDTGPKTPEAYAALREGLINAGLRLSDIRRIIITHSHEDHSGLTRTLLEECKDVEVLMHSWESGHDSSSGVERYDPLLARAGVPLEERRTMGRFYEGMRKFSDPLTPDQYRTISDEDEIEFESGSLKVLHTPGHTPGSCSFLREADRTVIAGDCVLSKITPNPVLSPDPLNPQRRFPSLAEYLVSLARIRELSPTLVYGGHGDPVTDYPELFNNYVRAINRRQKDVISLVPKSGSNAWEISQKLFSDAHGEHRFLAVSEVSAHMDLARMEGRLRVETSDGVEYYTPL
jgi:glyoxylase-like metal-dependent hydrolase (beta-lactamase superfamily II)